MKISDQFRERLDRLPPRQTMRAIVLLDSTRAAKSSRRRDQAERQTRVESVRRSAKESWTGIAKILEDFGGRALAGEPDALGSIPVETTPAGIRALAGSKHVRAILEDQSVSLPSR